MGLSVFLMIINGKVLYTSWKAEKDRLITGDDVTTLYVDLIKDSIHKIIPLKKYKKNLIIIEDVDRCIDDESITDDNVLSFLKGILKLKHYTCKNYFLREKLKSVVFIIAINEAKIYTLDNDQENELFKLFDYRLDLGKIHNEDFESVLKELLKKVSIPSSYTDKTFKVILRGKNNSIRLLKCIINDTLLKYYALCKKFESKDATIRLESCIAYSYMKNNYFKDFDSFLNDDAIAVEIINDALNLVKQKKDIINGQHFNKLIEKSSKVENVFFFKELFFFVKNNYIDEDFKQYFYNYPKGEKYTSINESILREYLFNEGKLNIDNNKNVAKTYILKLQEQINYLGTDYPSDILNDSYLSEQLFSSNNNDVRLLNFLSENLKLDSIENQEKAIINVKKIFNLKVPKERIRLYLLKNNNLIWIRDKVLVESKEYYEFRYLLVEFFRDDIIDFKNLFMDNATSISYKEFALIENKKMISQVINMMKFSNDLEKIFPELIGVNSLEEHIIFAKYWDKNVNDQHLFARYIADLLLYYNKYNYELLKILRQHYNLVSSDERINTYFNDIIVGLNIDDLRKINDLKYFINLDEENLLRFIDNKLYLTPLISLLCYERFEDIIKYSIEPSTFTTLSLYIENDYLANKINEFKKFILNLDYNNQYDLLFVGKLAQKYSINIDLKTIKNIHLLFECNYSNIDNIVNNIETGCFDFNQICYILDEIYKMPYPYSQAKDILVVTIMNTYPNIIKQEIIAFDEKLNAIISTMNIKPQIAKVYIYYQLAIDKFVPEYCDTIRTWGTKEDKQKYANFINGLDCPTIEGILSIDFAYPFNEKCINILFNNKYYEKTIKCSILSEKYNFMNEAIDNLQASTTLSNIYKEDQKYKEMLINNERFLNKIKSEGYISSLAINDIIVSLNNNMTIVLLKFLIDNYSDTNILKVLSALEKVPENLEEEFVNCVIKKRDLLKNNLDLANKLRNLLTKNNKRRFTINIIKKKEKIAL